MGRIPFFGPSIFPADKKSAFYAKSGFLRPVDSFVGLRLSELLEFFDQIVAVVRMDLDGERFGQV